MTTLNDDVVVSVNGQDRRVSPGTTVAMLVAELPGRGRGTAVARNAEVVPRSQWSTTTLGDQDRVEILGAAQGG
ncbi:MAG TPA: sulfur carrier protein ThiS [Acidimicrobiales bacterium]|nr:sulfur carrier protein ThiS [Acidimicrobiales bacterium]